MVTVETSEKIYSSLLSSMSKATTEVIILTPKVDQEFAEGLLAKAGSGVNVRLITSDKIWSKWLQNSKDVYRVADEKKIEEDLRELESNMSRLSRVPYILAAILYALSIVIFIKIDYILSLISFIVSTIIFISLLYYIKSKKIKEMSNQYNIAKESLDNFHEQSKNIRDKIASHLKVDESKGIGFSVLCADSECYLTSMSMSKSNEEEIHFFYKIDYKQVSDLISAIIIPH